MVKVKGSRIIHFLEKPKEKRDSNLISAGIYVLNPEIFKYMKGAKKLSMEHDVFPMLAKDGELSAYIHSGKWFDVSYPKMYKKVLEISKKSS